MRNPLPAGVRRWLALGCLGLAAVRTEAGQPQLIEFGWDEPDTTFLREHVAELRASPFDGCVFHADYQRPNGEKGSFTWKGWSEQTFTEADLAQAFNDLRAFRPGRFKSNFLRFNTTPAKLDWFDNYQAVLSNARLAARLARTGHCQGLLFDIEQYENPLFNYSKQRDANTKSWDLYAAQARKRGREVMAAFQEGYPGLTVFLTFGYSLPWAQTSHGHRPLAECKYGLLAPFLDGMLKAAEGRTRLVDGYEISYGYKTAEQFSDGLRSMRQELLPIVEDPEKYESVFALGFGIWLDHDWRKTGWNVEEPAKNYFTPESFESAVRSALGTADQYVWIYTEEARWWSHEGNPVKLPGAYQDALRRATHDR